jgi:sulfur carrier protein
MSTTKINGMPIVFVNNKPCTLEADSSLNSALEQNGITNQKGIAVAVNNAVVPKTEWQNKILNENDKITIIRATQGG